MRGERFAGLVGFATPLVWPPGVRNVAGAIHGFEIEARRAAHGSFEALRVTDRPGSHEATIAVAPDAGAAGIGIGSFQSGVDDGHQIEIIFTAPITANLLRELASV